MADIAVANALKVTEQHQEIERLKQKVAALENKKHRYRVKMNDTHGPTLNGQWFWLLPADEFAEKALAEVVGPNAMYTPNGAPIGD